MDQSKKYEKNILTSEGVTFIGNIISSKIGRRLTDYEINELMSYLKNNKRKDWQTKNNGQVLTVADMRNSLAYQFLVDHMGEYDKLSSKDKRSLNGRPMEYKETSVDVHELMKRYVEDDDSYYDNPSLYELDEIKDNTTVPDTETETESDADTEPQNINNIKLLRTVNKVNKVGKMDKIDSLGNIEKVFGLNSLLAISKVLHPTDHYKSLYILLDSKYRDLSTTDGTKIISWNFLNNSQVEVQGSTVGMGNIKNIVAVKTSRFRIPNVTSAINNFNKITLLIHEFIAQSTVAFEGRKYHFIFNPTVVGNYIDLVPNEVLMSEYNFRTSITKIDTLSISLGAPLTPIIFDPDRDNLAVITHFFVAPFWTITTSFPHNLTTGDQINITGFTTNAPTKDIALIEYMNRLEGHVINVLSPTTFDWADPPNTLQLNPITNPDLITPQTIPIYFASKRILIDLEFIYNEYK